MCTCVMQHCSKIANTAQSSFIINSIAFIVKTGDHLHILWMQFCPQITRWLAGYDEWRINNPNSRFHTSHEELQRKSSPCTHFSLVVCLFSVEVLHVEQQTSATIFLCSDREYPNTEHHRTGKSDVTYIHQNVHILLHWILKDLQTLLHVQRLVRAVMTEIKL